MMAVLVCAFVPVIAYPAYKASRADPNVTVRGKEAGFQKSGLWKEIDK